LNKFCNSAEQKYITETYLTAGYSWQMKCNKNIAEYPVDTFVELYDTRMKKASDQQ
jgi:hypothetical protein